VHGSQRRAGVRHARIEGKGDVKASAVLHGLPGLEQRLSPQQVMQRHRHGRAYAALVVSGSYVEAGDQGRRRLCPGDVVLHDAFSAHGNQVGTQGARLVNLPVTGGVECFARVRDPDAVVRLAATDPIAAAQALQQDLQPLPAALLDWPDLLARDLTLHPHLSLAAWAQRHGLAAETLSRGFARVFGITPRRWRFEVRVRRALYALRNGDPSLVAVALEAGFADQAHLTHAVVALTGRAPGHWRRTSSHDKTPASKRPTMGG
jgi:AraC-like DNA-binding protein